MVCRMCRKRDAKFRVRGGRVKADDHHDMCFQCYRAAQNRLRASRHDLSGDGRSALLVVLDYRLVVR